MIEALLTQLPKVAAAAGGSGASGAAGGAAKGMLSGGGSGGGKSNGLTQTIGLATSALQGLYAMSLKKKADAAAPDLVDPRQASFLAELNQKRHALETGADFASGTNMIDNSTGAVNNAISNNSGGNSGAAIQGILQGQANANMGKNQVMAQGQSNQFGYDNAYTNMLNLITMKKQSLQLRRQEQLRGEYSGMANAALSNFLATVAAKDKSKADPQSTGFTAPTPQSAGVASPPIEATGVQAPMVTPDPSQTISSQSMGTPMSVKKPDLSPLLTGL